jgi:hypothetical protein
VSLSRGDFKRPGQGQGHARLASALIEEVAFVGAYERLRLRMEAGPEECKTDETPFYLTTETPDRKPTKTIIATRPKPEASATRLHVGERVVVALTSFTVLPPSRGSKGAN